MKKFLVSSNLVGFKELDLPLNVFVSICLSETMTAFSIDVCLTANLATDSEVDFAVDGLISDLERVRRLAKNRIKADNEKVMHAASKRLSTK